MPPEPPRPGTHRVPVTEINLPERPTAPPPRDKRPPPRELTAPRTLVGMPAPPSEPPEDIHASREIPIETLLRELTAKAEAERAAKAEAAELRLKLAAAEKATKGDDRKTLIKLAYRLGTPLVLLMGAATAWLTAHTSQVEAKVDRVEETRKLDKVVTDPLPEKVSTAERSAVDCRAWARAKDDYDRQVFAKLGVLIPEQPNALPVKAIETRAPKRKATINGGIVLEVITPPPALP